MEKKQKHLYEFGPFRLDEAERLLLRAGEVVPLTPKAFDVLLMLVKQPGRLLEKETLLQAVWADSFVEEKNLADNISRLRKALGEGENGQKFIETVPKSGYRFVATIRGITDKADTAAPQAGSEAKSWVYGIKPRQRVVIVSSVIFLVTTTIALYFALRRSWQSNPLPPPRTLSQLTFDPGLAGEPAWSPDGRFIAYSSDRGGNFDIWVKPTSEGDPVQVTKSAAHDWQPDWSPDGTRLVFRSERDGGGLFVVPVLGGGERKVAGFGYRPRWSPDGSQILFYSAFFSQSSNLPKLYMVALDGKPPREVLSETLAGLEGQRTQLRAAWHPDGQRVSILEQRRQMEWGFWTVPLAGGQSVRSEVAPEVERRIKDAALEFHNFQWAASGRALYLEGSSQGVRNLWRVEVDPRTLRWMAGPERLTTGAGHDMDIALAPDGRKLTFTTRIERTRVWALPFDATAGRVAGTGQPVTAAGVDVVHFNLSRDDRQLAFIVNRAGKQEVRKKSLADGGETLLVAADGMFRQTPRWTPDGSRLAYNRRRFTNPERTQWEPAIIWLPANGGDEQVLAGDGMPYDWSSDGKWLLQGRIDHVANRIVFGLSPVSAAPRAETQWRLLASDPDHNLFHASFSPDNRWIVFNAVKATDAAVSTLYVIPATGGAWTRLTEGQYWDDKSLWAPDGRTIYFISNRGGYYNVWGIRFDPAGGKPVGEAFRVTDWEGPGQMISPQIGDVSMALTADRLLLPITEASGNIWIMENVDR